MTTDTDPNSDENPEDAATSGEEKYTMREAIWMLPASGKLFFGGMAFIVISAPIIAYFRPARWFMMTYIIVALLFAFYFGGTFAEFSEVGSNAE